MCVKRSDAVGTGDEPIVKSLLKRIKSGFTGGKTQNNYCYFALIFWKYISLRRGFCPRVTLIVQSSEICDSRTRMNSDLLFTASPQFFRLKQNSFFFFSIFCLPCPCLSKKSKQIYLLFWHLTEYWEFHYLDTTLGIKQLAEILGVTTTYFCSNVLKVWSWMLKLLDQDLCLG